MLCSVLALSACAGGERAAAPLKPPKAAETATAGTATAIPAATIRQPPAASPKPEKVYPRPGTLVGLDGDKVTDLLGPPGFKRLDAPAEIWQYRTQSCALDVFLYRDQSGNALTVRHLETRNRGGETVSSGECFIIMIKAHERPGAG